MKNCLILLYLFCTLCNQAVSNQIETITIYAYHSSPPFVINAQAQKGINYDLVRALQKQAPKDVQYDYQFLERSQLNQRLKDGKPTIALWANPIWFEKTNEPMYLWSQPLFWDKDVIVVAKGSKLQYRHAADLRGIKLGGIAGYFYHTINDMVAKKELTRIDSLSDKSNIEKLISGQVDAIIITKSSLFYYARTLNLYNSIAIIGDPHNSYKRHLLVTKHHEKHMNALNKALKDVAEDRNWRFHLTIYGLQDLWLSEDETLKIKSATD